MRQVRQNESIPQPLGRKPAEIHRLAPKRADPAGERLLALVVESQGVPLALLMHRSRCEAEVAMARQLAMYLMNVVLGRSFTDVGRFFGRDRTTVSHACALIEDARDDSAFDAMVDGLETKLLAEPAAESGELRHAAG